MVDCDAGVIQGKARVLTKPHERLVDKAVSLFCFVRDEIKYNPYMPRYLPEHFRASATLARREGFCVQKAVLLMALARAIGIPSRLGFAIIRNHLLPEKIVEMLQIPVFPDHGFSELHMDGKWVKVTPSFDLETCERNRIIPVEFDGQHDAKLHPYNRDGQLHIEYISDRGSYEDVPINAIREWLTPVLKPEARRIILGDPFP